MASMRAVGIAAMMLLLPSAQGFGPTSSPHIYFNRTISQLDSKFHFYVTFGGNATCKSRDQYGDNFCDFPGGLSTINWDLSSPIDLTGDDWYNIQITVDEMSHLNLLNCPICGEHCQINFLGFKYNITGGKCPIKAGHVQGSGNLPIPSISYFPQTYGAANLQVVDKPTGTVMIDMKVELTIGHK
eukprot:m.338985 g.338985  ORF g.338985 m.338985 type:complete len:185 (+) comp18621_c0_seq1:97-651(+)